MELAMVNKCFMGISAQLKKTCNWLCASAILLSFSGLAQAGESWEDGRVVNGYKLTACDFGSYSEVYYCDKSTVDNIIREAKRAADSKEKAFMGKYQIVKISPKESSQSSFVLVDLKSKLIFTSGIEFEPHAEVSFSNKTGLIHINDPKVEPNDATYSSFRLGSPWVDSAPLKFDPKEPIGYGTLSPDVPEYNIGQLANAAGYTINQCRPAEEEITDPDFISDENPDFCSKPFVNAYKKFSTKDINFAKEWVLIRLEKQYFAALNPKTKQVYAAPFKVTDGYGTNKVIPVQYSKNGFQLCSSHNGASMGMLNAFLYRGVDVTKGHKACFEFDPKTGWDPFAVIYNTKTGKPVPRL